MSLLRPRLPTSVLLPSMPPQPKSKTAIVPAGKTLSVQRSDALRHIQQAAAISPSLKHITSDETVDILMLYFLNSSADQHPELQLHDKVQVLQSGMVSSFMTGQIYHEPGASDSDKEKNKMAAALRLIRQSFGKGKVSCKLRATTRGKGSHVEKLMAGNTWLGTDSNLLGTDSVANLLVTFHNKTSPNHKVDYFGAGDAPTVMYEKGIAFALHQAKRRIKGERGGLAGEVNLTEQHIQQHAQFVTMLQFVRRIIAAGDCMLGVDGSVEIHATAEDVRAATRMAAKALEGLDEADTRCKEAHSAL